MEPRLKVLYREKIKNALMEHFKYRNIMMIPRLEKIVLSMGVGEAVSDKKKVEEANKEMTQIAGQKSVKTKSRKSIAQFKIREDMEIGCMVTLRGSRMYEFLDKLINVSLPSVKDFRGLKTTGFDGRGNYSLGVSENLIFPEIDYEKIEEIRGMNINIVTTAKTDEESRMLLNLFEMPFRKDRS